MRRQRFYRWLLLRMLERLITDDLDEDFSIVITYRSWRPGMTREYIIYPK